MNPLVRGSRYNSPHVNSAPTPGTLDQFYPQTTLFINTLKV